MGDPHCISAHREADFLTSECVPHGCATEKRTLESFETPHTELPKKDIHRPWLRNNWSDTAGPYSCLWLPILTVSSIVSIIRLLWLAIYTKHGSPVYASPPNGHPHNYTSWKGTGPNLAFENVSDRTKLQLPVPIKSDGDTKSRASAVHRHHHHHHHHCHLDAEHTRYFVNIYIAVCITAFTAVIKVVSPHA
jgi:hypothetical protein